MKCVLILKYLQSITDTRNSISCWSTGKHSIANTTQLSSKNDQPCDDTCLLWIASNTETNSTGMKLLSPRDSLQILINSKSPIRRAALCKHEPWVYWFVETNSSITCYFILRCPNTGGARGKQEPWPVFAHVNAFASDLTMSKLSPRKIIKQLSEIVRKIFIAFSSFQLMCLNNFIYIHLHLQD